MKEIRRAMLEQSDVNVCSQVVHMLELTTKRISEQSHASLHTPCHVPAKIRIISPIILRYTNQRVRGCQRFPDYLFLNGCSRCSKKLLS